MVVSQKSSTTELLQTCCRLDARSLEQRERLADRFRPNRGWRSKGLESLLAAEAVLHGAGKVPAIARPLHGRSRLARTLVTWSRAAPRAGGATVRKHGGERPAGAIALDIALCDIQAINSR